MKFIANIFIFFCFFPYLDLFRMGTDTQPNGLIAGTIVLFAIKNKKINVPIILLWLSFFFATLLVFYNNLSFFLYLKNTLNYLSPPLVCMATYAILTKMNYKVSYKMFLSIVLIYGFVGFVQLLFIPDFLTVLVNGNARGILIGGRGVVSLSPEPAFYGSTCLFFMIFSLMSYTKRQNYVLQPLLLAQILLLAWSTTAMAILLAALLLFTVIQLCRFRVKYVFAALVMLMITLPILFSIWSDVKDTRMGEVAQVLIEDPLLVTQVDVSVGVRFTGTVAPFLLMRHNWMKPQGFGFYSEFLREFYKRGQYRSFISAYNVNEKPRLGGAMNSVLFQLGFLGLVFPLAIYLAFRGQLRQDAVLFSFILFMILLMTQIQLMHGMIGFIIAAAIHRGKSLSVKSHLENA